MKRIIDKKIYILFSLILGFLVISQCVGYEEKSASFCNHSLFSGAPPDAEKANSFPELCKKVGFNPDEPGSFYFIQLSDTHIIPPDYKEDYVEAPENFRHLINEIANLEPKPAFVMITGDLTQLGEMSHLQAFKKCVDEYRQKLPDIPLHLILGNHDDNPDGYLKVFPDRKIYYSFDYGEVRFLAIYTWMKPPHNDNDGCNMGSEQTEWLKKQLDSFKGKTAVIFAHAGPEPFGFGYDCTVELKSCLTNVPIETDVWLIGGDFHGAGPHYRVGDLRGKDNFYGTHGVPSHSGGYEVHFIKNGRVIRHAWRFLTEGPTYTINVPPDSWKMSWSFAPPEYKILLLLNTPEEDGSFVIQHDGTIHPAGRFSKGANNFLSYCLPGKGATDLLVQVFGNHVIELSSDGKKWQEVFSLRNITELYNFQNSQCPNLILPIPPELQVEKLFVRLYCPTSEEEGGTRWDGVGVEAIGLLASESAAQVAPGTLKEIKPSPKPKADTSASKPGKEAIGDLILYQKFNEGQGDIVKDSSSNNNNGKVYGATWTEGKFGHGLGFDGQNDYVDFGDVSHFNLFTNGTDFTVEFWLKVDIPVIGNQRIIGKSDAGYTEDWVVFTTPAGDIDVYLGDDVREQLVARTSGLLDDNWHHYAVVRSGNDVISYADGFAGSITTITATPSAGNTKPMRIGDSANNSLYFNGIIDEVKIYSVALSQLEVLASYAGKEVEVVKKELLDVIKWPYLQNLSKDRVTIMWETNLAESSQVKFGLDETCSNQVTEDEEKKVHEVTLSGLIPDTKYYYQVFSKTKGLLGKASFTTAPDRHRSFNFIAYGDTRSTPEVHKLLIKSMLKEKIEFILHTGDLVRAGSLYEVWGTEFFGPAKEIIQEVPLWPSLGNHEYNDPLYFRFFSLPGNEHWYSFDYSNAHFIALDTNLEYTDFRPDSEQYDWLRKGLSNTKSDWKFVFFHHPPYSSGPHGALGEDGQPAEQEVKYVRDYLVPLFEEYKVDMVFSGHDHLYERSKRGDIYYIITGGGTGDLYDKRSGDGNQYTQVCEVVNHYCIIKIDGRTLMLRVKTPEGKIIDELKLSK